MKEQPKTLREVIADCGGAGPVAKRLRCSRQYIHEWMDKGHVPLSELKINGGTRYSEVLAEMQQAGNLTADEIRLIGLNVSVPVQSASA